MKFQFDAQQQYQFEAIRGAVDAIINPVRMGELGLTPKTGFTHIIAVFLDGVLVRPRGRKP